MIRTLPAALRARHTRLEPVPLQEAPAERLLADEASAANRTLSRVGVFWSAEATPGAGDSFYGSGKYVAASAWVEALARWGTLSHMDVFAPLASLEPARARLQAAAGWRPAGEASGAEGSRLASPGGGTVTLQVLGESDAAAQVRTHAFDLLHEPTGLDLSRAGYLRSRFSEQVFPMTCSQHGISYSFDLHPVFLKLLTAPVLPCDAIVCCSPSARQALSNRLGDIAERYSRAWDRPAPALPRLEMIPWGVDTQRFAPRDPQLARRDLDLPPDRPILLCLGRVRIQDKMDWTPLLLAFERVCRSMPQRPLLVLAGGADPEYSEQLLAHAAHLGLAGDIRTFFNLPAACLPSLYAACDIFVSPADTPSESFGLTIVEAMACGRPVVASDWDGYKELIVHGETGFKVRADWADCLGEFDRTAPLLTWEQQHLHVGQSVSIDVGQMARYLLQLLQDRTLRDQMGRRGRARVMALYDWPVVIRQWESLWAELAGIARTLGTPPEDRLDYLQPHYFEQFSHYASRIVDDATPVTLTDRGREHLAGRGVFFLHPRARGFLRPESLQAALAAMKPAAWLGASLPLRNLLEALRKRHGLSRDQALMHVLWLAKYDLLALEDPRE